MARDGYTEGVPTVSPSLEGGGSYQSARGADIEAFGGGLAQAGEEFGRGAMIAGKFFGKVAADDASNQFQDFASKLLHGDPSKMVAGPDGSQVPDTGYLGTKGRSALDARPAVQKQIDDKIKELRAGLQTPEQQLEFDNFSRRYRTGVVERVGNHADQQSTSWYASVNTATAKLAMDQISNNWDKPELVAAGAADLTAAYVKNAQIKGGSDLEIRQAINDARRDALGAQLDAMAVNDPARAMRVLDKNKDIAGVKYDEMSNKFRARAEQQAGIGAGVEAIKRTYQPAGKTVYTDAQLAAAGAPYGISAAYLARTHALEGDGVSKTGAKGPFQFIDSTAREVGVKDPFNPEEAAAGAARLAAKNKVALASNLGRVPTDAELYLAHQQGPAGAAALLEHPNMTAAQALVTGGAYKDIITAARKIRVNGGDPNAPASQFTNMWTAKFNGALGMAVAQRRANALQAVLENPDLSPQAQSHAIQYVNQQMAAQKVAMEEDDRALRDKRNQAQTEYVRALIQGGDPNIIAKIAADPTLSASEIENLYNFSKSVGVTARQDYGKGYTQAYRAILSDPSDPQHISDVRQLIERGDPENGDLTPAGVRELSQVLAAVTKPTKEVDQSGIHKAKSAQLDYYKSQFVPEPLYPGLPKNQKGLDKYNREFIPAYEAAYRDWLVAKKDPMQFLSDPKIGDAIMNRIYPPNQRRMDMMQVGGAGTETETPKPPPPAPAGADQKAWDRFMASPPMSPNGKPWSTEQWAKAIELLRADPSETRQQQFDKHFAPSGYTAKDILSRLPPAKKVSEAVPTDGPSALRRAMTVIAAPFAKKGEVVEEPAVGGVRG